MRGKVVLGAVAVGAAALLFSGGCDDSGDGTEPDGGSSDYVSNAPLPDRPSIDISNPTTCSPRGSNVTIRVSRMAPSALVYTLRVSWFNDSSREVMKKSLNPERGEAEVTFSCKGKAKGHYRVEVEGGGTKAEDAGFDVYPYTP